MLGSLQANESLNNAVSVHSPKGFHFSGSASQQGRVAFSVTTKNNGKSLLYQVWEET